MGETLKLVLCVKDDPRTGSPFHGDDGLPVCLNGDAISSGVDFCGL